MTDDLPIEPGEDPTGATLQRYEGSGQHYHPTYPLPEHSHDGDEVEHWHPLPESVDVVPVDDTLRRDDVIDHIAKFHRTDWSWQLPGGRKATKDTLLSRHERWHETQPRMAIGRTLITPHTHTLAAVTPAPVSKGRTVTTAIEKATGVTASERSVLRQLVDNDAKMLEQELRQMAADMARSERERINDQFRELEQLAESYNQRYRNLKARHEAEVADLIAAAKDNGLTKRYPNNNNATADFEPERRSKELGEAEHRVQDDLNRALRTLTSQRLKLQRQILLLGITSEAAQDVVESLPTARDLMRQAAAEEARQAIEAER